MLDWVRESIAVHDIAYRKRKIYENLVNEYLRKKEQERKLKKKGGWKSTAVSKLYM